MCACADLIHDKFLLYVWARGREAMGKAFAHCNAPATLGNFLRAFAFGHVRQIEAVASHFLVALATALYVTADDLIRSDPERVPARLKVGLQRQSPMPNCSRWR